MFVSQAGQPAMTVSIVDRHFDGCHIRIAAGFRSCLPSLDICHRRNSPAPCLPRCREQNPLQRNIFFLPLCNSSKQFLLHFVLFSGNCVKSLASV